MSFNLPNPSLMGILLVISTHNGPQLVFKYPPNLTDKPTDEEIDEDEYKETHSSDEEDDIGETHDLSEFSDDEWDSKGYSFYSGTKKDLMLFLDAQERYRQETHHHHSQLLPVSPTGSSTGSQTYSQTQLPLHPFQTSKTLKPSTAQKGYHRHKRSEDSIDPSEYLKKTISGVSDSHSNNSKANAMAQSNIIFGIEQDYLIEMLCPPKQMCNSRFEINIDNYIYLGLPIHCYDNGTWKRKHKSAGSNTNKYKSEDGYGNVNEAEDFNNNHNGSHDTHSNDSMERSTEVLSSMNMFHLVFIMKPPVIESNYRIDEMYHYVISRLSLVLRHEQLKHDYIWAQTKLISKLKEEFNNQPQTSILPSQSLTNFLIEKSTLAKLICDCFQSISNSDIANLSINNKLRSFQIPIKTEFHSVPESTVPYLPGSHLSSTVRMIGKTGLINVGETTRYGMTNTMSMIMGGNIADGDSEGDFKGFNDEDTDSTADDIIYLALLLLDDPETIIKDIKAEPDLILASFIRMIKPTESLLKLNHKLGNLMSLEISQIKSFAFHLIYWRRARVIPPLNTRSVYIVSPMAPITINMYYDITKFKQKFPSMPSLSQFLKLLSSPTKKPKQFSSIIPSKDHKEMYLSALGWLIRYGYVTQLHTFIWLKVSKRVKIKVEEDLENEISSSKKNSKKATAQGTDNTSKVVEGTSEDTNGNAKTSRAVKGVDNFMAQNNLEENGNKAAKDLNNNPNGSNGGDRNNGSSTNSFEKKINTGPEVILEEEDDTIILDPGRANTLERKWINKIVTEECKLSPELTSMFYNLLKYMNGKTSLELLLLKEKISRNDFRRLLIQIEDHIISVRHW